MSDSQHAPEGERVAEAQARALDRVHRQRQSLRPLGWAVIVVVAIGSANSHPVPSLHGKGLGVTLALAVFAAMLLLAIRDGFPEPSAIRVRTGTQVSAVERRGYRKSWRARRAPVRPPAS